MNSVLWFKHKETSAAEETQTTTSASGEIQIDIEDNNEHKEEFVDALDNWQSRMTNLKHNKDSIYDDVVSAEIMRIENEGIPLIADRSLPTLNDEDTRKNIEEFKSSGILSVLDVYATKYREHRDVMFMAQNCLRVTESVKAATLAPFNLLLLSISYGLRQAKIRNVLQTFGTGTMSMAKKRPASGALNMISSFAHLLATFRPFSPTLSLVIDAAKAFLWSFTPSPPSFLHPILWAQSLVFSVNCCFKMISQILFNYKFYQLYFDSLVAVSKNPAKLSASYTEKSAETDKTKNEESIIEIVEDIEKTEIAVADLGEAEKTEMQKLDDSLKKRIGRAVFMQHLAEITKMAAGFTLFWSFICLLTWLRF